MTKVLITGALGNVGSEVLLSLNKLSHHLDIYAAVRNAKDQILKGGYNNITFTEFDFTDTTTYKPALQGCEILFLLRPPQITQVKKYFKPLIKTCLQTNIRHIVFLSVQGVEKSKVIPHHKIERIIVDSKISYTFLRPAYFMQNFTTTLRKDLVNNKEIYLPAGNARFTLIDVKDIGEVSASILNNTSKHINKAYELTSKEKLTFSEMAKILTENLGVKIKFSSPNLISFFLKEKKENLPVSLILVMIMLHYLPRFQKEPEITDWVEKIINRQPTTFKLFINENRLLLTVG